MLHETEPSTWGVQCWLKFGEQADGLGFWLSGDDDEEEETGGRPGSAS